MAKILVVDDEPEMEQLLKRKFRKRLRNNEFEFIFAKTGVEALKLLSHESVDLILSDINMPEMDGLTFLTKLQEFDHLSQQTIMISASGDMKNIRLAMNQGAYDFLVKPLDLKDLEITIDKTLAQKRKVAKIVEEKGKLEETLDLLQKTQKQLITQEKMASLGGLVAGVAHEINTPLGIAVTAASFLSQETKKIESLIEQSTLKKSDLIHFLKIDKDSSKIILANLRRAEELIRSFKQVAVDQTTQECRSFNIKSYMDEVLTSLHPKIRHTNVTVSVDCSESIELESFPGALSQIITNLVMNSLLHGYDRHEKGTIEFKVNQNSHNKVVFIYTDDGKGIPEENLNKIFDPFFTTKRGQGGTGLGLHIIYNIITQQLKGSILCESKVGNGTTFTITLPTSITKNSSTLNQITVD